MSGTFNIDKLRTALVESCQLSGTTISEWRKGHADAHAGLLEELNYGRFNDEEVEPIPKVKSWDKMYMDIAIRVASESKCPRKKVGCAILLDSGLIATGLNGFPAGQEELWTDGNTSNPLVTHAELNAMGKLLEEGVSCKDATVYVTLSPCVDCSKLLVRAKVKRVVYLEEYRCTAGVDYLRKYGVRVEKI